MGLLDYYRQFEDEDEEEINRQKRERRHAERRLALEQVPDLDLSGTEWPDLPNSEVVNASIAIARGRVNSYPDRYSAQVRRALADVHEVEPEQIAVGNGAAELLQAGALALLSEGDELVTPWPSYPLYPLMAARAGAKPVPVDTGPGGTELHAVREAVTARTRLVVICNPNDPTGHYLPAETLAGLIAGLPEHVHVLLDEALVHFQDVEDQDACLRLVDAFPRLVVVRTFSKIYGLSGLRAGYAVGSTATGRVLDAMAPVLGVNTLTQAGILQALRIGGPEVVRRRQTVLRERARLLDALHALPIDAADSQANFVWLRVPGMSGAELASRLQEDGVIVAPGGPLGADDHVRASVRNGTATDRLLRGLERAVGES
jgi:histidinol-phosphate aminotransferase